MNSTLSEQLDEKRKEAEIRRQIALLQSKLPSAKNAPPPPPQSPKRKRAPGVLAPATPSPKKRKVAHRPDAQRERPLRALPIPTISSSSATRREEVQHVKPAPSLLLNKLNSLHRASTTLEEERASTRSTSFAKPAVVPSPNAAHPTRDDTLAIIETLEMGPIEHKPPVDDVEFEALEPYSGIRLKSRSVSYSDFQDYMQGRYFLSPSMLYSVVRLQPNKQAYDVPVEGDYVIIGVVAERLPVRMSKAPVGITREAEDDGGSDDEFTSASAAASKTKKGKGKGKGPPPRSGRKYVTLKLIDFGARSASSATGGKAALRGDAFLNLLLFESEDVKDVVDPETGKKERVYRGGSRGAFEQMAGLREGSVVALLNPRVLRPFQKSNDTPHPVTNVLGITPESAESAMVLGYAKDLGICAVVRKDGKPCGSWTDKRTSEICDYHVQNAVQQRRAGRAEFSTGTTGLASASAMHRKKAAYDPARQWGLRSGDGGSERQQEADGGGATYVVQGHVVSRHARPVAESMGREEQSRAARKRADAQAEKMLQSLANRDSDGMRAVVTARDRGLELRGEKAKGKGKAKEGDEAEESEEPGRKNAFTATMVKHLGFDPTARRGQHQPTEEDLTKKLADLSAIQASRSSIQLGPRPGKKQTTVRTPPRAKQGSSHSQVRDLSDSDLDILPPDSLAVGASDAMVDLDGSSDLEIEG